jgi:hypothetical protein
MKTRFGKVMKLTTFGVAVVATLWAAVTSFTQLVLGGMVFVDITLPKRSFLPFLHEIPDTVRDDVLTAHKVGLKMLGWPLIVAVLLWMVAYAVAVRTGQHKSEE